MKYELIFGVPPPVWDRPFRLHCRLQVHIIKIPAGLYIALPNKGIVKVTHTAVTSRHYSAMWRDSQSFPFGVSDWNNVSCKMQPLLRVSIELHRLL